MSILGGGGGGGGSFKGTEKEVCACLDVHESVHFDMIMKVTNKMQL
jgi:hypothetical protein